MIYNLIKQDDRIKLIGAINSENNKARKQESLKSSEVAGGRIHQYVKEKLLGELDRSSVREMPLVSSINIQKAICDKKATIYKKKPERRFTETNDAQNEVLQKIYRDMCLDEKLNTANKNFIYQDQTIGMIVPKGGKLICRILKMHQIDAIPSLIDPEQADGYIISAFDRTMYTEIDSEKSTRETATGYIGRSARSSASQDNDIGVAEKYQFQKYVEKYIVWSNEYNFMMNGLGEVIDPLTGEASNELEITNPIGMLPFFEVSRDKDFEYFVRSANNITDFTVQFNAQLSDLANNIKMNGYAVGVLKAPSELQPQHQVVGASMLLKLPTDNPDSEVDFAFTSPNSNIGEISDAIDRLLNYFVTSEGLGGSVINSRGESEKATSGIDRYLMMLSRIEAHQDDYDAFKNAEKKIYKIIKAWLSVLNSSDMLDAEYKTTVPEISEIEVLFNKPEMIQTESEKIANIEKMIDLGLMSKKQAIMEIYDIEDEQKALDILEDIKEDENFTKELNASNNIDMMVNETDNDMEEMNAEETNS